MVFACWSTRRRCSMPSLDSLNSGRPYSDSEYVNPRLEERNCPFRSFPLHQCAERTTVCGCPSDYRRLSSDSVGDQTDLKRIYKIPLPKVCNGPHPPPPSPHTPASPTPTTHASPRIYLKMVLPSEPEFEQALNEISSTLGPLFERNPEYKKALAVSQIPERVLQFRVVWEDDSGNMQVNRGYRVQFNSALGPYKGGLRFHPSVNLSILKFLGFEQIFKNALTGLMMGGGKGGADFNPKGKSDNEIRKFCYAFMQELSRHIGADTDVPAGDIGVGGREVAYMFGAYKKYRNEFTGVLTGKGMNFGGSNIRPEATGYGLVYYVSHMLAQLPTPTDYNSKRVLISGSGNVAQYAALKVMELGGNVLSLSDSQGALIAKDAKGFTVDDIAAIANIKLERKSLNDFVQSGNVAQRFDYHEGARPWTLVDKVDIALPSATQNEVSKEEAEALVAAGCKIVAEGSNMGSTQEAIDVFEHSRATSGANGLWYAPGKAANCGGVAVSGLEMAQNSQRLQWSSQEVDDKLKGIMKNCYEICYNTGKDYAAQGQPEGTLPSLVMGANIAGFIKVADAMKAQGNWW